MADESLEHLLGAALAGDQGAYRAFLTALVPHLRRMARAALPEGRRHLAEDVVQEVLIVVHAKRASWDPGRPLMAWLRVILRHKAIDALRREPRAAHDPIDDHAADLAAPASDPLAGLQVERMLNRLPHRDAALIRAHAIEGRDAREIAARHGLTPGTLRVALHRALARLAEMSRRQEG